MQFDIDGKEMSLRLSQSHEATRSNGGSAANDRELRAMDEARAIGREKDNRFGDFLGLGRTASGRLSGQLLKPFTKRIRAFSARGSPLGPYSAAHTFVRRLIAALLEP